MSIGPSGASGQSKMVSDVADATAANALEAEALALLLSLASGRSTLARITQERKADAEKTRGPKMESLRLAARCPLGALTAAEDRTILTGLRSLPTEPAALAQLMARASNRPGLAFLQATIARLSSTLVTLEDAACGLAVLTKLAHADTRYWQMVARHDGLIRRQAKELLKCREFDDVYSMVQMGWFRGAMRFEPARGWRFPTMAKNWGRAWLQRETQPPGGVHVPFGKRGSAKIQVSSLDDDVGDDTETLYIDMLEDESTPNIDESTDVALRLQEVETLMSEELTPRERRAMELRYGGHGEATLSDVGAGLGVTRERSRQILVKAMVKMRRASDTMAGPETDTMADSAPDPTPARLPSPVRRRSAERLPCVWPGCPDKRVFIEGTCNTHRLRITSLRRFGHLPHGAGVPEGFDLEALWVNHTDLVSSQRRERIADARGKLARQNADRVAEIDQLRREVTRLGGQLATTEASLSTSRGEASTKQAALVKIRAELAAARLDAETSAAQVAAMLAVTTALESQVIRLQEDCARLASIDLTEAELRRRLCELDQARELECTAASMRASALRVTSQSMISAS